MCVKSLFDGYRIILASASPRRKELLRMICDSFDVVVSECEEQVVSLDPGEVTKELSMQKADEVAKKISGNPKGRSIVIGADTVVSVDGHILGKPGDWKEADRMIRMLSGKTHSVMTGVAIIIINEMGQFVQRISFSEKTEVKVCRLSEEEIYEYIQGDEPYDKAGSYAIQGQFGKYIEGIEGDYNNVVGLPVNRVYSELKVWLQNNIQEK